MDNHKELADARVQVEILKRKKQDEKESSTTKKKKINLTNEEEKMHRAPKTQMALNSISALHHLKTWKKYNEVSEKEDKKKILEKSIKTKEKYIKDFDSMVKLNDDVIERAKSLNLIAPRKWHELRLFNQSINQ